MRSIIVDSDGLVALFDPSDQHARGIKASLARAPAAVGLITTWPCVTEATHILERLDLQLALLAFLHSGRREVREFHAPELAQLMAWMRRYADFPMDFADASLVRLASTTGVVEILTTDREEFQTYRLPSGRRFRVL